MSPVFEPNKAKGWNPRGTTPQAKKRTDLYSFAARARREERHALANSLSSIAESLPIIEGRCKYWARLTGLGRGAAPLDSARGGGDGMPAEVRASLAIQDAAARLREFVEDWCE